MLLPLRRCGIAWPGDVLVPLLLGISAASQETTIGITSNLRKLMLSQFRDSHEKTFRGALDPLNLAGESQQKKHFFLHFSPFDQPLGLIRPEKIPTPETWWNLPVGAKVLFGTVPWQQG